MKSGNCGDRSRPPPPASRRKIVYKHAQIEGCPTSVPVIVTEAFKMMGVWRTTFLITFLAWVTFWFSGVEGQEYLPPKAGSKKQPAEPTQPANYNFSYDVEDNSVSLDFGHTEKRKDDRASGSYHVLLPDGRMQLVEYEAGPDGYKAQVMYMGTATYPAPSGDKFDGYHYNAASNRQSVRQAAPRGASRQAAAAAAAPAVPPAGAAANTTAAAKA